MLALTGSMYQRGSLIESGRVCRVMPPPLAPTLAALGLAALGAFARRFHMVGRAPGPRLPRCRAAELACWYAAAAGYVAGAGAKQVRGKPRVVPATVHVHVVRRSPCGAC